MSVIPVVDLLAGQVVRAVRGNRSAYRPIDSALCRSSEPRVVAGTLCEYTRSQVLYVADLDALLGRAAQTAVIEDVLDALPDVTLWVDAGFCNRAAADAWLAALGPHAQRTAPVFGSESLASREDFEQCFAGPASGLLSLDGRHGQAMDRSGCWNLPALWPLQIIVMTLDRVGADAGPDLDTLTQVRQRAAPGAVLIGAGGVRNANDLARAREAGAHAWLVASALHDMKLPRAS